MLHRIIHSTLALLLFISSSGIILNQHFCQGALKDTAIFAKAEQCHAQQQPTCPMHPPADMPDDCCDNQTDLVKNEQDQQLSTFSYKTFSVPALAVVPPAINWQLPTTDYYTSYYRNYKPPPLVCDYRTVLQTFRL